MRMRLSTLVAGLIVGLLLALTCEAAQAQVQAEIFVPATTGYQHTPIRNPTSTPYLVTVAIRYATIDSTGVHLEEEAAATLSPRQFTLEPGQQQVVRFVIDPLHAPNRSRLLRFVTVLEPILPEVDADTLTAPVAQLVMRLRLDAKITWVEAQR